MPKIKKSKRIAERRAGLQESHQEAHVNEQHPKEHPVSSNRDGVLDKSPGQAPEVAVLNSEAGTAQTSVSFRNEHIDIPQMIVSYNNNLALNVSQDIRNKIVNGQYVDLAKLLGNSNEPQKQTIVMVNGELQTTDKASKKINNIQQWTDAFIIYASIYLQAHPTKSLDLLKYMSDIRLAAARSSSLGFREYDQQFRLKLSNNPSGTWGVVDPELWLLYVTPSAKFLTADTPNQSQNKKCYTYNYQGSCFKAPCYYLHLCLKCNASHPFISCSKKEQMQ